MKPVNLQSYADFATLYSKCRNKEKGKPLPGGWRLHQQGDKYVVTVQRWRDTDLPIFVIGPDNVLTFRLTHEDMCSYSQTLVTVLWKIVPLIMQRVRKETYKIGKVANARSTYWYDIADGSPEYFEGIAFNLLTQECLNPKPDLLDSFIPEVRKQWLRDVKRFKKGLKARAKVGAFQGYIHEVNDKDAVGWRERQTYPKWTDDRTTQHVLESMRTEQYPPDLLKLMVLTVNTGWSNPEVTDRMVLENVDRVFDMHSLHYRKAYGVFG